MSGWLKKIPATAFPAGPWQDGPSGMTLLRAEGRLFCREGRRAPCAASLWGRDRVSALGSVDTGPGEPRKGAWRDGTCRVSSGGD